MFLRKFIHVFTLVCFAITFLFLVAACGPANENRQTNTANSTASPAATTGSPTSSAPKAKLNVNTASQAELLSTIPGMGNKMVHEFEEYRPYKSIQQFRKEIGKYVGQDQVKEYEKYIFVPIHENQIDAATLQQIPGLDAKEAEELIAGRPYASRDAFLAKLGEKVSANDLAIAKTYLVQP
jgi:DNA uptake protein ComE-like DNA-binding protein